MTDHAHEAQIDAERAAHVRPLENNATSLTNAINDQCNGSARQERTAVSVVVGRASADIVQRKLPFEPQTRLQIHLRPGDKADHTDELVNSIRSGLHSSRRQTGIEPKNIEWLVERTADTVPEHNAVAAALRLLNDAGYSEVPQRNSALVLLRK